MTEYDDIIDLPRPKSAHEPMLMSDRAAQFSPFAALTGYEDAIDEAARLTDARVELAESAVEELERRLNDLAAHISERPEITIAYFVPDARKEGGAYQTHTGALKRIDEVERELVFEDGTRVGIDEAAWIDREEVKRE